MKYLHDVVKVTDVESLQFDYPGGTLILTDNQAVIDLCIEKKQPVVAFEHDGISMLKCDHILIDPDEVDDEEYEDNCEQREPLAYSDDGFHFFFLLF